MAETSTITPKTAPAPLSKEIAECWQRLPDKPLFLILLSTWLLLFQFLGNSTLGYINTRSLFAWMDNCYSGANSDDSHGWLIPVVVIVLLWMKRDQFLNMSSRPWAPALLLLGLAAGLHFVGYLVQQPRISILALFLGIYSIAGIVWGPAVLRRSFFPMILFVFCVPVGSLAESITFPLRILVTQISVGIGHHVLGIDVIRNGSQIFSGDQSFQYDVAPACSGIRSLISLSVFAIIYAFLRFRTAWKRLLIICMAVPLAVLGNVIRITTVIVVAEAFGQDAGARIEQNLGFVTFAVAIVTTLSLGYWLRDPAPAPADAAAA